MPFKICRFFKLWAKAKSVMTLLANLSTWFLTLKLLFLLRKIALPYPHKCLFGFVEQKRIDRQEFFKEYSCHKR